MVFLIDDIIIIGGIMAAGTAISAYFGWSGQQQSERQYQESKKTNEKAAKDAKAIQDKNNMYTIIGLIISTLSIAIMVYVFVIKR